MLAVAFRALGNAAEAEDIVQEVWLRWQNADRAGVRNAAAFLKTATLRLAINRATGARTRHEAAPELSSREPVDLQAGPGVLAERGQAVEVALRLLLEKLSPTERAAYLLREAFDCSYLHIARVVGVSEAGGRQLLARARKHLADGRRLPVAETEFARIAVAFIAATRRGDLAGLEAVLVADIVTTRSHRAASRTDAPVRAGAAAPGLRSCSVTRPLLSRSVRGSSDPGWLYP
jgi:RNA polymerase sigma-70 factor, ECF subfamily